MLSKSEQVDQTEKVEVKKLLKNLQTGLRKFTLKEFNDSLSTILNKSKDKNAGIEYVFHLIQEKYGVSEKTLKYGKGRNVTEAKQMSYCLFYFNLGLSTRYIALKIFQNWQNSVQIAITRMKNADMNHKEDAKLLDTYNTLSEKLIQYIKKNNL